MVHIWHRSSTSCARSGVLFVSFDLRLYFLHAGLGGEGKKGTCWEPFCCGVHLGFFIPLFCSVSVDCDFFWGFYVRRNASANFLFGFPPGSGVFLSFLRCLYVWVWISGLDWTWRFSSVSLCVWWRGVCRFMVGLVLGWVFLFLFGWGWLGHASIWFGLDIPSVSKNDVGRTAGW